MSKDGKTPWAAGTLHMVTDQKEKGVWMSPFNYNVEAIMELLYVAQKDKTITGIKAIDINNNQYDITINRDK